MFITKKEIAERFLNHFETLKGDNQFSEFLEFLSSKNIILEVRWDINYHILNDSIDDLSNDSDTLFYIYDKSYYLEKGSIKSDLIKSIAKFSSKEKGNILYEVHRKLDFLYSFGTLKKLQKQLNDTNDFLEVDWATNYLLSNSEIEKMLGEGSFNGDKILYANLLFYYDSHLLLLIPGNRSIDYGSENERFTKSYFASCVRSSTDLINLKELVCYDKFSNKTKNFIEAGNLLLDLFFKDTSEDLLDFSPLLLDFTKGLECEVKEFYDGYYSYIIPQAELIIANKEYLRNSKITRSRVDYLIILAKNILAFKRNFQPSGVKPLAYFLYYFGLGDDINRLIEYEGFFSLVQREKIIKEISVIDRLFNSMEKRNEFIHSKMIESRNEFLMLYSDIVLTFQLLGSLKEV